MKLTTVPLLVAATLSAFAGLTTDAYFRTGVTSRGSCGKSDTRLLWYGSECLPNEACANTPGVSGYTHEIMCIHHWENHSRGMINSALSYLIMELRKGTSCDGDFLYTVAIIPDGTCYPTRYGAGFDGFTASIGTDNKITVTKHRDYPACSVQNFKAQNKATQADRQTCLRAWDVFDGDIAYKMTIVPAATSTTTRPPTPPPTTEPPTTAPETTEPPTTLPVIVEPPTTTSDAGAASASSDRSSGSNSTTPPLVATEPPPPNSTPAPLTSSSPPETSTSPTSAPVDDSISSTSSSFVLSSENVLYIAIGTGSLVVGLLLVVLCMCCRRRTHSQPPATPVEFASVGDGLGNHGSYFPSVDPTAAATATVGVSTDRRNTVSQRQPTTTKKPSTQAINALLTTPSTGLWVHRGIQNIRINLADVAIGEELSRGGFGIVSHGTYQGQPVAVKRLLPARSQTMRDIESFLGEAKLLSELKHTYHPDGRRSVDNTQ